VRKSRPRRARPTTRLTVAPLLAALLGGAAPVTAGGPRPTPRTPARPAGPALVAGAVGPGVPRRPIATAPPRVTVGGSGPWSARYGGEGDEEMEGLWITRDGGLVVTGSSDSFADGRGDAWMLRLDGRGRVVWERAIGAPGDESLVDVRETPDGGFVAVGYTEASGAGGQDAWVVRLDPAGEIVWQRTYGGAGMDQAWSVELLPGGGFLVAGGTTSFGAGATDYWLLELDPAGAVVRSRTYGGPGEDGGGGPYAELTVQCHPDPDGNLVLASLSSSFGSGESDLWVLRLDPLGDVLWQRACGGPSEETVWQFTVTADGEPLLAGSTVSFSPDGSGDLWVVRLDRDGNVLWQRLYATPGVWSEALAVAATADGGALAGGYLEEPDDWDWYVLRLDARGDVVWGTRLESGWDWPNAVREMPDGSVAVAGVSWPAPDRPFDLWVVRLAADGSLPGCDLATPFEVTVLDTGAAVVPTNATVTEPAVLSAPGIGVSQDTRGLTHRELPCPVR